MSWFEFTGVAILLLCGTTTFLVSLILLTKPEPIYDETRPVARDIMFIYMTGQWYTERQEALAEEAVAALGWDHDPYSMEAEICREVVTCGRHPGDAILRLREMRSENEV